MNLLLSKEIIKRMRADRTQLLEHEVKLIGFPEIADQLRFEMWVLLTLELPFDIDVVNLNRVRTAEWTSNQELKNQQQSEIASGSLEAVVTSWINDSVA